MTQDEAKRMAARRALEFVEDGMSLGLGSGTTSALFIRELGARVQQGLYVRGIATSEASQKLAESFSIPITNFTDSTIQVIALDPRAGLLDEEYEKAGHPEKKAPPGTIGPQYGQVIYTVGVVLKPGT